MTIDLTGYKLTYDDEFNSFTSSPDGSSGYQTTYYFGGRELYSNGDQEYYSDSTVGVDPFTLSNGALQITAAPGTNPDNQPYNSGLITTEGMFSQAYGYFEARVECAQGAGMWSAFWMLPESKAWPPEIDILEAFGQTSSTGEGGSNLVAQSNHAPTAKNNVGGWHTVDGNSIWASYHTYGVDWEPDTITLYIDGKAVQQIPTPTDENQPMYMLLDLAVGGWPGNPVGETGVMSIDYLRAYSKNPNADAVALQTISSPDGVDTTPNGATDAHGQIGTDKITVRVSEDAYQGDAQFFITVDGQQVGGVLTATTSHAAGQWQNLTLNTTLSAADHVIGVNFINDLNDGTASTDRNLYVQSVSLNGELVPGVAAQNNAADGHTATGAAVMEINGTANFDLAYSSIDLKVSEDAWNGNANFIVTVDGLQLGGIQAVTASHAAGQWQDIVLSGYFSDGAHNVAVRYINDAWGGSSSMDRNMYIQSIDVNGEVIAGNNYVSDTAANGVEWHDPSAAVMSINGTATYHTQGTAQPLPSTLVLHVSEDAWNGDSQFTVSVDGHQVGGTQTATALHSQGQVQDITLTGDFGDQGPGKISVTFLNDGWGGSSATDRNLYIDSLDINGVHFAGSAYATDTAASGKESVDPSAAVMAVNGTTTYNINHEAPPSGIGSGGGGTPPPPVMSTLSMVVSEDAYQGDAKFSIISDGQQVGGIQTVTAIHGDGQWQTITLTADLGPNGPNNLDFNFLNDAWGGSSSLDRNMYIQSIDVNGVDFAGTSATDNADAGKGDLHDPNAAVLLINGTVEFHINYTAPPPPPDTVM